MSIPPPSQSVAPEKRSEETSIGRVKSPPPSPSDRAMRPQVGPDDTTSKGESKPPSLLSYLRELSAEMLDLKDVLLKVQLGEANLATFSSYISKTKADVEKLFEGISDGDTVRHILNAWEQMQVNPLIQAPDGDHDAQQQLHYLSMLEEQINKVIFLCGSITIPNRLTDWLQSTRPGYYIPFHHVFEDEIPNPDDRQRLLKYLAWSPKAVKNGYVDVDAGLIYRYSNKRLDRWLSVLFIMLAFGILTGLVIGASYINAPAWPLKAADVPTMLFGWLALIAGIIVHIGIASVKRSRERNGLPALFAPGDVLFILNAHTGQILIKLFIALIGFFGLVFAVGVNHVTLFSSFLVGYSLDSFVEIFGSSLEQRAQAQLTTMQQGME